MQIMPNYTNKFISHWYSFIALIFLVTANYSWAAGGTPYSSYTFPKQNLTNIDFFFSIEHDPGENTHYYWAQQFWFVDGSGGYLGLQRDGSVGDGRKGKVAIFSIWDVYEHEPGPGAHSTDFGGEGTGASVRTIYNWQPGRMYRFRLEKSNHRWWKVTIRDMTSGKETYLGKIRAAAHWRGLKGNTQNFTEKFWDNENCKKYPYTLARFNPPIANYGSVTINNTSHWTGNVCTQARTYAKNDVIFHETGINNKPKEPGKKPDNGKPNPGDNNQPKPSDPVAQGVYQVISKSSKKCLDNYASGQYDGNNVVQWRCNNKSNQQWKITAKGKHYQLQAVDSNKCLAIAGYYKKANVHQWHCGNHQNQLWRLVKRGYYFQLQSIQQPYLCLDINGNSRSNGANILLWSCNNSSSQRWKLKQRTVSVSQVQAGIYQLQLVNSDQCLDNTGGGYANGNNTVHYQCHNGVHQKWKIAKSGNFYKIESVQSQKCIESSANYHGANIHQWQCQQNESQLWDIKPQDNGFLIKRAKRSSACLGSSDQAVSGGNIHNQSCTRSDGVRWFLKPQ